jgi:BirA family biotin operon repressor/biotin-[acetyl-CoA-carboxylase] ligase
VNRDVLTADEIRAHLGDRRIDWRPSAYYRIVSTNQTARLLAEHGAPEGTLVVAETQSRGHGRRGSEWVSPPGGLWFSFVLRPELSPDRAGALPVLMAVAIARTLWEVTGLPARIKWPNDVFVGGRKIAGAMVTAAADGALVAGVGVNVNVLAGDLPAGGHYEATSVLVETGQPASRVELLASFLSAFEKRYLPPREPGQQALLDEWRELSLVLGEEVEATERGEALRGTVFGIEDDGGIVIRLADGTHRKLLPTSDVTLGLARK